MTERILNRFEREYKNMEAVCAMLNALCRTETIYRIETVYLDYGQDWKWTTICNSREVQVLSPRDWQLIVMAETANDLANAVNVIRSDKYFRE